MPISPKTLIDFLNSLESHTDITREKFEGCDIWPLIRIELYNSISMDILQSNFSKKGKSHFLKSLVIGNLKYPLKKLQDKHKNSKLKKVDVLFLSDGISFSNITGRFFERFSDSLTIELKNKNITTLRLDPYHNYMTPRFFESIFIQPQLDYVVLKSILTRSKNKLFSVSSLSRLKKIFEEYKTQHFFYLIKQSELKIQILISISKYFEQLLKKVQPKIVFITWYYGLYGMAMIKACRTLGIKTVDVQHGVQGPLHAAYGGWKNVPAKGYNLLPDYFWCWSDSEKGNINDWSKHLPIHKPILGGNVFLIKWMNNDFPFVKAYDEQFKRLHLKKKKILITLSPGISSSNAIGELYKAVYRTQDDFDWLIRLHPNMLERKDVILHELKHNNILRYELDETTKLPLYTILKNVDLHVTHSSSTVLEASASGIKSVIVNDFGSKLYAEQIASGDAFFASKSAEIIECVIRLLRTGEKNLNFFDKTYSDALDSLLLSSMDAVKQ